MFSAAGFFGSPGIVIIFPVFTTTNSAPFFSSTELICISNGFLQSKFLGSSENEYCVFAMHTGIFFAKFLIFSISNGYIDVTDSKYTPIKGVYNPDNQHCDETETKRNISWVETAMLANGCSEVTLVDAESEILLISRR